MATVHEIQADRREVEGKGASRRLRHADKVPAVLYGAKQAPANIQLDHKLALQYSQNEWFYSSILSMKIGGETQKVLLRDIQRHAYKLRITHLDFQRVSETEKLRLMDPYPRMPKDNEYAGNLEIKLDDGIVVLPSVDAPRGADAGLAENAFIDMAVALKERRNVSLSRGDIKQGGRVVLQVSLSGINHSSKADGGFSYLRTYGGLYVPPEKRLRGIEAMSPRV